MSLDIIKHPKILGHNLKKLRLICDFTVGQASEAAGISKGFLSMIECGNRNIKFHDLRALLRVYGYSIGRFMSKIINPDQDNHNEIDLLFVSNSHGILLDGSREEGKYHLILLRPLRHDNDIELLELYLPPETQMTKKFVTINTEIRGIVQKGRLLVSFKKDEFVAREGEEFCFDGNTPHILRNFTNQPTVVNLIIYPPEL